MGKTERKPKPGRNVSDAEIARLAMQDFPPLAEAEGTDPRKVVLILRLARTKSGLTAADVAEQMGVDPATVSRLEAACRADQRDSRPNPTLDTLTKYAAAVGKRLVVSLEDL